MQRVPGAEELRERSKAAASARGQAPPADPFLDGLQQAQSLARISPSVSAAVLQVCHCLAWAVLRCLSADRQLVQIGHEALSRFSNVDAQANSSWAMLYNSKALTDVGAA